MCESAVNEEINKIMNPLFPSPMKERKNINLDLLEEFELHFILFQHIWFP